MTRLQPDVLPTKYVHLVRLRLSHVLSVDPQLCRAAVAESHYGDFCRLTYRQPFPGNVDKGFFLVPVGFVEVEGVLFFLAVVSHKTFIVASNYRAFATAGSRKVEHAPDEIAPQERPFLQLPPVLYMIIGLPVFRMPLSPGFGLFQFLGLLVDAGTGTILADAHLSLGMCGMLTVNPMPHLAHVAAIPAKVFVESYQVGESVKIVVLVAGTHGRT